jgi:signal transduction histidine kinase
LNGAANEPVKTNGNGTLPGSGLRESTLNLAVAPLVSKELDEIGRLIIFDDITDRSELERRLVQADKLSSIGLLAAGVAHEVNTPLAVISTYAQMLAKQVSEDDQKSRLLDKIAKQTFRASEIVNSLLNFSRTSPAEFGDVDMNRILEETVSLVKHQLDQSRVEVRLEFEKDLPAISGNAGKLQQVFLNLVLNARDAMDSGGRLTLRTCSDGAYARIDVSDTGQGISTDHLPRIYDPFFTTKVARKGTGLGLSVTYGIVQEHGGSIEVHSESGAGTLFHLEFPLARKPVNA